METRNPPKSSPPGKRGSLCYEKCTFCRKDKKKCQPNGRKWPGQKCIRCINLGRECSESVRAATDRPSTTPSESTPTKQSEKSDDTLIGDQSDDLEEWDTFRALSAQSSWITHIERVCDSVQMSEAIYAVRLGKLSNEPDLSEVKGFVLKERQAVRSAAKQAIQSQTYNPMVKFALASVLKSSSLRSYEGRSKPPGVDCFDAQEDIPALVQGLQESGDLGYAISVQESYLNGFGSGTSEDVWKAELKRYYDLFQEFGSTFKRVVAQSRLPPYLLDECLPLLETSFVRQAAIRHLPCTTAKDVFGRNLLHIALYSGYTSGIDELIERLSKTEMNAKDYFGRTPLHIAATFGFAHIVSRLLDVGVDISPRETSRNLTPLHCAAAAGQEGTVAIILARLVAAQSTSTASTSLSAELRAELRDACAYALNNKRMCIVRNLLPRMTRTDQAALKAYISSVSGAHTSAGRSAAPVDIGTGSGYDFIPELTRYLAPRESG